MTFDDFEARLARELEVTRKEQALAGVKVVRAMAERLPGGSPENPVSHLEGMSGPALREFCRSVAADVEELLRQEQETLLGRRQRGDGDKSGEQGNSKFAQGGEVELRTAVYGKLEDFAKGLVEAIGLPDPRLMEAMKREHCMRGDSKVFFSPGNYDTTTTPAAEWGVVTDEAEGRRASEGKRRVRWIEDLLQDVFARKAGLRKEEILALLLYTGPMFYKYNAVLRGFPEEAADGLQGNKYTTTLHLIVSAVIKLSRCMVLPKDRVVYRGLKDIRLPKEFLKKDAFGVCGGLELGLMSTTEDQEVAIHYSESTMPTVFEIGVGAVDRGAPLKWVSQYPGEEEILFPPRSFLEVTGDTRTQTWPSGTTTRVVVLSVNANQTCGTIEDMLGARRRLHVAMLENYQAEIEGELQAKLDSEEVTQRLAHDPFAKEHEHHRLMVTAISKEVEVVVKTHEDRGAAWYNEDDGQYESAMKVAMQLKQMALGKFQHWMEGAHAKELEKEPMHVVRRKALATLHRRLTDVQRRDLAGVGATVASELCKELGLLVKSVDETNEEGEPPLVEAGSGGNVWALELLLAAGCEVGSASQNGSQQGWTALHWASLVGHKGSVACLVEAGADVHATTEAGETCLTVAAGAGQSEVVKYLAEKGGVGLVLAVNSEGRSCAFLASEQGHHEALGVLLEAGGTELLMLTDKDGFSCAWVASMNGHAEALGVLIEAGGKELLMLTVNDGRSCAHMASQNGHVVALRVLLKTGGKELLMLTDEDGWSCAYMASQNGHAEALRVLFEAGGKELLMLTDNDGASCAYMASENGHVEALEVLIGSGGTELLMLTNKNGASCAFIASENGHAEALGVLIEAAAGRKLLMLKTNDGFSCADIALEEGHAEVLKVLQEMLGWGGAGGGGEQPTPPRTPEQPTPPITPQ